MIRITQSMQIARTLRDQNLNLNKMNDLSYDMTSGFDIHRPSDDPIRVARAMRLITELSVNSTYKTDLNSASSWVSKSDDSLIAYSNILKRISELTEQAASGTLGKEDKQKVAAEISELKKSAMEIANDDYMGRYEFSGFKTDTKFINHDGYLDKKTGIRHYYNTDLNLAGLPYEKINYNIGVGQQTTINTTGVDVFGHEYFGTKERAGKRLPFNNEGETILGGNINIELQKYKIPDPFYNEEKTYDTNSAQEEDINNHDIEENYEKTTKLTEKLGDTIKIENINFFGSYKKDDIDKVIEDLNNSLRSQIKDIVSNNTNLDNFIKTLEPEYTKTQMDIVKKHDSISGNKINDIEKKAKEDIETETKKIKEDNIKNRVKNIVDSSTGSGNANRTLGNKATGEGDYTFSSPPEKSPLLLAFDYKENKDLKITIKDPNNKETILKVDGNNIDNNSQHIIFENPINGKYTWKVECATGLCDFDVTVATQDKAKFINKEISITDRLNNVTKNQISKKADEINSKALNDIKNVIENSKNTNPAVKTDLDIYREDTRKEYEIELNQAVQFVADDGKITMITDRNYGGKIEPQKINLNEIKADKTTSPDPTRNPNGEIVIKTGKKIDYSTNPVKTFFQFDLKLKDFEKDEHGQPDTSKPKNEYILKDIFTDNYYEVKEGETKEEAKSRISELIKNDLQRKITEKLTENNIPSDSVKVVLDSDNQPELVINRLYEAQVDNDLTDSNRVDNTRKLNKLNITNTGKVNYKPTNEDPSKNTFTPIIIDVNDFKGSTPGSKKVANDKYINISFDLDVIQYKRYGSKGDKPLEANPGTTPTTTTGETGHFVKGFKEESRQELKGITLNKKYSAYSGGKELTENEILNSIAQDLESVIDNKIGDPSVAKVTVDGGKLKIEMDPNKGYNFSEIKNNTTDNAFVETSTIPGKDNVDEIELLDLTSLKKDGDNFNVFMDLDLDIIALEKDEKGNPKVDSINDPFVRSKAINAHHIQLSKSYNGKNEKEAKKEIVNDIKKEIENKLNLINPPLDKRAVNVKYDDTTEKISITVSPDYVVTAKTNKSPDSIEKTFHSIPKSDYKEPTREMMPFFEMMDRIEQFMNEGNSKGLSRMLKVIDYHLHNNQKNEGIFGASENMYKIMIDRTEDIKLNYSTLLSKTRGTDYNAASTEMTVAKNVYRASLAVTARLIQPSLVDFLR